MSDLLAAFSHGCVNWSVDLDGSRILKVKLPDTNLLLQTITGRNPSAYRLLLRCQWATTEYELRFGSGESTFYSVQGELSASANDGYRNFTRIDKIAQFYQYATGNLDFRTPFQILWIQYPGDPDRCAYGWEHAITWRYPLLRVVHSHFIKPTARTARTLLTMRHQLLLCPRIRFDGDKIRVPKLVA